MSSEVSVIIVSGLEGALEGVEVGKIFFVNIGDGNAGSGLGVDELTKLGLGGDEAEWDILLSAQSWEEDEKFHWFNISGHNDEFGLVFFNKGGNVVESILEVLWLGTDMSGLSTLSGFSFGEESGFLVLGGLW